MPVFLLRLVRQNRARLFTRLFTGALFTAAHRPAQHQTKEKPHGGGFDVVRVDRPVLNVFKREVFCLREEQGGVERVEAVRFRCPRPPLSPIRGCVHSESQSVYILGRSRHSTGPWGAPIAGAAQHQLHPADTAQAVSTAAHAVEALSVDSVPIQFCAFWNLPMVEPPRRPTHSRPHARVPSRSVQRHKLRGSAPPAGRQPIALR